MTVITPARRRWRFYRGASSCARAFTILELLIVVAIIALLMAILVPTLRRAREQARRVACLSNLRSLGLGLQMYQGEYNGFFPAPGEGWVLYNDWITAWWAPPSNWSNSGALVPYTSGSGIFIPKLYMCPSDTKRHTNGSGLSIATIPGYVVPPGNTVPGSSPSYAYSYSSNWFILQQPFQFPKSPNFTTKITLSIILNPAKKILLIDESADTLDDGVWAPDQFAYVNGVVTGNVLSNRHDRDAESSLAALSTTLGTGTVVFVDGHAETISRADAHKPSAFDPQVP